MVQASSAASRRTAREALRVDTSRSLPLDEDSTTSLARQPRRLSSMSSAVTMLGGSPRRPLPGVPVTPVNGEGEGEGEGEEDGVNGGMQVQGNADEGASVVSIHDCVSRHSDPSTLSATVISGSSSKAKSGATDRRSHVSSPRAWDIVQANGDVRAQLPRRRMQLTRSQSQARTSIGRQRRKFIQSRLAATTQQRRLPTLRWLLASVKRLHVAIQRPFTEFGLYGPASERPMSSYLWFWFLILLDVIMVMLYFVERGRFERIDLTSRDYDVIVEDGTIIVDGIWWTTTRPWWLYVTEVAISFLICTSTFFRVFIINMRITTSIWITAIDIVTAFMFVASVFDVQNLNILYVPSYLRVWVIIAKVQDMFVLLNHALGIQQKYDVVHERIVVIIMTMISFTITGMMAVQWAENIWGEPMSLFNSMYMMVVTVTTVGYGDITPRSWQGRLIISVIIVLALYIIPAQISALNEAFSLRRASGGGYRKSLLSTLLRPYQKHVVVCISSAQDTPVVDALNELGSQESSHNDLFEVVILLRYEPSTFLRNLITLPYYRSRVFLLQGSSMDADDLARAGVRTASAVFLISDKYHDDHAVADRHNTLRAWAVQEHSPNVPLYVLNNLPEHRANLKDVKNIALQTYKQALMAANCLYPGVSTLLLNLWRQSSNVRGGTSWLDQYGDGVGNELYEAPVGAFYINRTFSFMCLDVYQRYGVIMLGVRTFLPHKKVHHTLLNPTSKLYDYVLQESDIAFFIAQDFADVQTAALGDLLESSDEAHELRNIRRERSNMHEMHDVSAIPRRPLNGERFIDTSLFTLYADADDVEPLHFVPGDDDQGESHVGTVVPVEVFEASVKTHFPDVNCVDSPVNECFVLRNPVAYDDAEIKNADGLRSHVVVCGQMKDHLFFVSTLRSTHLRYSEIYPIVFVHAKPPSRDDWKFLRWFPFIYYLVGDPKKTQVLLSAGVRRARRVVVAVDYSKRMQEDIEEPLLDVGNIMMTHKIFNLAGEDQIRNVQTELIHRNNWRFIPPQVTGSGVDVDFSNDYRYMLSPVYASGRIISTSMIDGLLFQVFMGRENIMPLIDLLCNLKKKEMCALDDELGVHQQRLHSIRVPSLFFGPQPSDTSVHTAAPAEGGADKDAKAAPSPAHTFGHLFQYLMEYHGVLAIGLHRQPNSDAGSTNTFFSFVYTSPWPSTPVLPSDLVYVLASPRTNALYHASRREHSL